MNLNPDGFETNWDVELMAVSFSSGIRNTAVSNPRGAAFEMHVFWLLQAFRSRIGSCLACAVSWIYCPFPSGYDALSYSVQSNDNWSGRQLLQANEENTTDVPEDGGKPNVRNCTEPGRNESCFWLLSLTVGFLTCGSLYRCHLYCQKLYVLIFKSVNILVVFLVRIYHMVWPTPSAGRAKRRTS